MLLIVLADCTANVLSAGHISEELRAFTDGAELRVCSDEQQAAVRACVTAEFGAVGVTLLPGHAEHCAAAAWPCRHHAINSYLNRPFDSSVAVSTVCDVQET